MNNPVQDFTDFMKDRETASIAFVNGNVKPLAALSTTISPASLFGPKGTVVTGADKVNEVNAKDTRMFSDGSTTRLEIMELAASDTVAYWAGIQRSNVKMQGSPEAIPMDLRVTEVFRREDNTWKLVHRHADALKLE